MRKAKKIFDVPEELVPISHPAISVKPSLAEVSIPNGTIAWKLGDAVGFVNKAGLQDMIKHNPGLEYDEEKTTIPKPIGYRQPFGKSGESCKTC